MPQIASSGIHVITTTIPIAHSFDQNACSKLNCLSAACLSHLLSTLFANISTKLQHLCNPSVKNCRSYHQASTSSILNFCEIYVRRGVGSQTMPPNSAFSLVWSHDRIRDIFLSLTPKEDLASLRLVCHDFSAKAAPFLFQEVKVTFRSSTFAKQSRVAALERVGHYVKSFHFNMPHSNDTFLAPLIDPATGEEVRFIYEPHIQVPKNPKSRSSTPSYGSWEMTDLLVKQYQPLFHAAANVPAFIRAFSTLNNLTHLKISCPHQELSQRYRRSVVDYALISVRIAVERCGLLSLDHLSLVDIHAAAMLYLNPNMGFGTSPRSLRRWKQIRQLTISVDSIRSAASTSADHLKHLQSYLNIFSSYLRVLDFRWQGDRCPCPIALHAEGPMKAPSPPVACPSTYRSCSKPIRFSRLRTLRVENTMAHASQIARFISRHHRAVRHTKRLRLEFDNTILCSGTWDEALEPLTQMSGSESWKSSSEESIEGAMEEFMDVPIMLGSVDIKQEHLHKFWDTHVRERTSKPYYSGLYGLQKAGAKTRELLFGTEEHMRKLFSSTMLGWR